MSFYTFPQTIFFKYTCAWVAQFYYYLKSKNSNTINHYYLTT